MSSVRDGSRFMTAPGFACDRCRLGPGSAPGVREHSCVLSPARQEDEGALDANSPAGRALTQKAYRKLMGTCERTRFILARATFSCRPTTSICASSPVAARRTNRPRVFGRPVGSLLAYLVASKSFSDPRKTPYAGTFSPGVACKLLWRAFPQRSFGSLVSPRSETLSVRLSSGSLPPHNVRLKSPFRALAGHS